MSTVWAIANLKGGVGKTSTAVSLAGWLSRLGRRVLLVDLDPQGSATSWLSPPGAEDVGSVFDLFQPAAGAPPTLAGLARPTACGGLHLVPADPVLATLDRHCGARPGMGLVLHQALAGRVGRYSHVILDCPPVLGILLVNALAAADRVIVPVQTEFLALRGLDRMLATLRMMHRHRIEAETLVVPTLFDRRTRASRHCLERLQGYAVRRWAGQIPVDTRLREAAELGRPLPWWRPASRAALAYRQLLAELEPALVMPERAAG